jgi:protein Tob/BTG
MKEELQAAVDFMCNSFFTFKANPNIELNKIKETLTQILQDRYKDHWYVDKPLKGQAYRCIRLRKNDKNHDYIVDLLIKKMQNLNVESCLCKVDITLWIDPGEVSYRYVIALI